MSQSSDSAMDTNIFSELSAIAAENKGSLTATEQGKKRPAPIAPGSQVKKMVTNQHLVEKQTPNITSKSADRPTFVSAAEIAAKSSKNIQIFPEIPDEELLQMALKFEKEHPQYSFSSN